MPRVSLPLIGPSYTNRSLPLSAQVSKGLLPQIDPEARNIVSLHAFPGLKPFSSLSGKGRGSHKMAEIEYVVYGTTLSEIDSTGTSVSRGTIVGESICGFADNGTQMMIVTGSTAYMYTASTQVLAEITDPDLVNPTTVGYLNNQFIFDDNTEGAAEGSFVTSQVVTTLTPDDIVNTQDRATADAHPDDITRIMIYNAVVIFFGIEGIEPWWNSGSGNPPFDPIQSGFRPYGLAGKDAIAKTDEFVYFLDNNRIPRRLFGFQVANIGNPALANEWSSYVRVDDAVGMSYVLDQKTFFQINFPTANKSWLYHEESNSWYQLSFGTDNQRHRGMSQEFAYGKNLIQDYSNGQLYELDFDTFTDNGEMIQRKRATAYIHGGLYGVPGKEIFFDRVEFVVQTGVGIAGGRDPQLMIRSSDDGSTWTAEQWHSLGVGGDYTTRVVLDQQGSAFQRIYELTYTEPTPFALIDAQADISVGI